MAPLSQDVLTRIVNVNWKKGGAVFVYGFLQGTGVEYVKITAKDAKPVRHAIALPGPGPTVDCNGSSYALIQKKPVFLVLGERGTITEEEDGNSITTSYAMIYRSNDGLRWTVARQEIGKSDAFSGVSSLINTAALVWNADNNSFYYDQNKEIDGRTDQIFSSADGNSWGMISSTPSEDSGYRSSFPSYCTGNDCVDANGQNVPDGVMQYDKKSNITVKPTTPPIIGYSEGVPSWYFASAGETWGSSNVEVVQHDFAPGLPGHTSTVSIPGVKKVFCVAGANGIFMAGGSADLSGDSGAVALSVDGGKTWAPFATYPNAVTTMIAAPAQDLPTLP